VYAEAEAFLASGDLLRAEGLLRPAADAAPRAAQTVYLLGITLFLQGRIAEARRVVDRAFQLKLWVREPGVEIGLESALVRYADQCADWDWVRYELLVRKWSTVGFGFERVVATCLEGRDPFLLQVGANDGQSGDPLLPLFERHDWRGLLLEPMDVPFAALSARHRGRQRINLVNAAIADHDGTLELYLGTSNKTTLASARPDRNVLSKESEPLQVKQVECVRFETLFEKFGVERVDLLQIDTEGMDAVILRSFDLEKMAPTVVQLEFYCLPLAERIETMERFDRNGYVWKFLERDLLAVRRDALPEEFCLEENALVRRDTAD
jgi:FkbM family methyltransferase